MATIRMNHTQGNLNHYSTTSAAGTTHHSGRAGRGTETTTEVSSVFGQDSLDLSSVSFTGADASFNSTVFNGEDGSWGSNLEAGARAGSFDTVSLSTTTDFDGFSHRAEANVKNELGAFIGVSSSIQSSEDSSSFSASFEAGAGARTQGSLNNTVEFDGGGSLTANLSGSAYAGAYLGGQVDSHVDSDTVRLSGGLNYAAGAGAGFSDTVGFTNSRGSGLQLTAGATASAGTSGAASFHLERDGTVTTVGIFASGDLGVGGGAGFQISLDDQDSVDLVSLGLEGTSALCGDTLAGQTASTFNQFVEGDIAGLSTNPLAAPMGEDILAVGDAVDHLTVGLIDGGQYLSDYGDRFEQRMLDNIPADANAWDIGVATGGIAYGRVVGFLGDVGNSLGLIGHRMTDGKRR